MFKTITWLLLFLRPSEPCLRNLHQHAPELSGICRNPPEPSGTCLWNLHQDTPELAGSLRNPPEPSGTGLRNLHQHQNSLELSGTLRNSPVPSGTCLCMEPIPAHTGTFRNFRNLSPEPALATRTSTHRSLSGLKTPLPYAGGEKFEGPTTHGVDMFGSSMADANGNSKSIDTNTPALRTHHSLIVTAKNDSEVTPLRKWLHRNIVSTRGPQNSHHASRKRDLPVRTISRNLDRPNLFHASVRDQFANHSR